MGFGNPPFFLLFVPATSSGGQGD